MVLYLVSGFGDFSRFLNPTVSQSEGACANPSSPFENLGIVRGTAIGKALLDKVRYQL